MNKKGFGYVMHLIFSIVIGLVYIVPLKFLERIDYFSVGILFCISIVYGLLPDIDIKSSKIYKVMMVVGLAIALAGILLSKWITIAIIVVLIIMNLAKHRKIVHSHFFGLLLSLPLLFIGLEFFFMGVISYFLHLWVDRL